MSQPERGDYLGRHLYHELQRLLCPATEELVQQTINPNDSIPGQHIKMYAMDSAALHARALFEFLTSNTVPNHVGIDLYGVNRLASDRYRDRDSDPALGCWSNPLHAFLMHLRDRTVTQRLKSFDRTEMKDLSRMPVDFAREVVELWQEFVRRLRGQDEALADAAQFALDEAIAKAARVATSEANSRHGISPIAW